MPRPTNPTLTRLTLCSIINLVARCSSLSFLDYIYTYHISASYPVTFSHSVPSFFPVLVYCGFWLRLNMALSEMMDKAKNYVSDKIASMKKPEAEITDVDFKKASFNSVEYLAKVSVTNPYSHSVPICEISYKIHSSNRLIASGTVPDPGSLKGDDTTVLNVAVTVAHTVLLSLARDIGADWDIDYLLEIGLTIDLPVIGNFTIPLTYKGEFKLPTISEMFGWGKGKDEADKDEQKEKDKEQ